ncbi:hypothetical protein [Actinomadura rupiterrae]|uniref:hypothetical protein n=1 Tax=Actinomadura rupiterrae TaxID=559627 RepID=UPI0020A5B04B|nr:hypothetical protein [Actinomadura rupiterrae]MCP2337012.1 hypothetical protein [Actinomadura rupiterrae]
MERLVPQAVYSDVGSGPMKPSEERTCDWDQPGHETDVSRQSRHLTLSLTLDEPNNNDGLTAQRSFALDKEAAEKRSGNYANLTPTKDSRMVEGPFRPVAGLGVDAFTSEYRTVEGPPLPTDTQAVELKFAYRGLLVEITYRGEDTVAGKPGEQSVTPLPAETARTETLAVAREVITTLNTCRTCGS